MLEAGNAEQAVPNDEVLNFATAQDRAVLTINRKHFVALHRLKLRHAEIIVCTLDVDFAGQAQRIHDAISQSLSEDETLRVQLLRVNRSQV